MTTKTMGQTLGDVLKHEYLPAFCRETVTLLAGTSYKVGHVLAKVTASGKWTLHNPGASDGTEQTTDLRICLFDVDATAGDQQAAVLERGPAIVAKTALQFHANVDTDQKKSAIYAGLATNGIKVADVA